jgi:SAM-dependent MidA family methyltransferase
MIERLDAFMARANAAYYTRHNPYADFTTAPEISQVFGELLGLWAAVTWQALDRPTPLLLAEAGPGRGTLMVDALRAIAATVPDFADAIRLHLIETSPSLRAEQRRVLPHATWHDRIEDLPPGPLILLANEFLDALPIRQFIHRPDGWAERWVAEGTFVDRPAPPGLPDAAPDTVLERREPAEQIARHLAQRLVSEGGAALFIDYGPEHSAPGNSLQALRKGRPADPLANPGDADLTAHVDFAAFATAARAAGATVHGPVPQGIFLARLGLFQRTDRLARFRPVREVGALLEAARRLAEPDQMGRLFKVLALCHAPGLIPAGFASDEP